MPARQKANPAALQSLAPFLSVTFGVTWLCWLPLLLNRQFTAGLPVLPGQFYLGSFGPLLGTLASVQMSGRQGVRQWAKRAFSPAFPLKWLLLSAGLPLAYGAVAAAVHTLITGSPPDLNKFGLTSDLPAGFNVWMTSVVWIFTFGLGEESGWRGYLLPELHKRYSLSASALLVAGVWMLWHLPAFWFNESYMGMGFGVVGWAISISYGSVVLAWICAGSRWSLIPVIIWHAIFDLLTASDQAAEVMAMVCSILVIVHGILLMRTLSRRSSRPPQE
ncbi:CPBP family intramembrane glutamic endopeptidase [Paenibacillus tengchongensis]|uniref:CPBP family intramembrane glutamic endopeptidase n=1 Tax=Paenibacillus tengchongensis TaxID=2608684 RepID=UPI00124D3A64|nr:CPBP family intramembrane glutamic endopeptidase [Paenibacillus tengchongensis]